MYILILILIKIKKIIYFQIIEKIKKIFNKQKNIDF